MFKNLFNWSSKPDFPCLYAEVLRNDKCYCNCGKKYKHCHLSKDVKSRRVALYQINEETLEKEVIHVSTKKMRKGLYPITSMQSLEMSTK